MSDLLRLNLRKKFYGSVKEAFEEHLNLLKQWITDGEDSQGNKDITTLGSVFYKDSVSIEFVLKHNTDLEELVDIHTDNFKTGLHHLYMAELFTIISPSNYNLYSYIAALSALYSVLMDKYRLLGIRTLLHNTATVGNGTRVIALVYYFTFNEDYNLRVAVTIDEEKQSLNTLKV